MTVYKIVTSPTLPRHDPHEPLWRRILGRLYLVRRARFVMMHRSEPILWAHPDSVPSLTRLLAAQGHKYQVQPALVAVPTQSEAK